MNFYPKHSFRLLRQLILILMATLSLVATESVAHEHVILLHGMCRTKRSMQSMEQFLVRAGFHVSNINYPSRSASIDQLSENVIGQAVADCRREGASTIHFVTHSLGGILVRSYLARHQLPELGRVVMLGPPNRGSEVVDRLHGLWLFQVLNGPAGSELGTGMDSVPNKLGAVKFCLGVIAGNRSWNWINSCLIAGRDDGKVSVERTKVEGMTDHIVISTTHPFIMKNRLVMQQTEKFLKTGRFDHQPFPR
ncbi:MAG: hypothetical protein JWM68_3033 [Verrucomicrobiales bacterium]|nr:hypothetical protein [Verrucomicrobiales bacterium]